MTNLASQSADDRPRLRPATWAWAAAAILSVGLYLPYMSSLLSVIAGPDLPREASEVATASWALGEAIRSLLSGAGVPAALAAAALAGLGAISLARRQPHVTALLVMPAVVTLAGIAALGQPIRPRFIFFFLFGAGVIFIGRGLGAAVTLVASQWTTDRPQRSTAVIALGTLALIVASAPALSRNYEVPKQDFERTVAFLTRAEADGLVVAAAGPACLPLDLYYGKPWRCLNDIDDWAELHEAAQPAVITYTLADYVEDPRLRAALRSDCAIRQRFPGTLGGGDLVVCEVPQ